MSCPRGYGGSGLPRSRNTDRRTTEPDGRAPCAIKKERNYNIFARRVRGVCTTEVFQLEHVLFKGEWKSTSGTVEESLKGGSKGLSNLFRGAVCSSIIGSRVVDRCFEEKS